VLSRLRAVRHLPRLPDLLARDAGTLAVSASDV
jgi:hypothetical protein